MTRTMRTGAAALALGGLLLASGGPSAAEGAGAEKLLPVGSAAPKFEAVDIDGKPFSLEKELSGGPVLLVFWSIF